MTSKNISIDNLYFAQAAERLAAGVSVLLRVEGNSMLPFIQGGKDTVTLVPHDGKELPLGIAALYRWQGKYMIHRLVGKDHGHYRFLGDGNICRIETIRHDEILGILQTIHHTDGTHTDATSARWRKNGMWWYRLRPLRRYLLFVYKKLH